MKGLLFTYFKEQNFYNSWQLLHDCSTWRYLIFYILLDYLDSQSDCQFSDIGGVCWQRAHHQLSAIKSYRCTDDWHIRTNSDWSNCLVCTAWCSKGKVLTGKYTVGAVWSDVCFQRSVVICMMIHSPDIRGHTKRQQPYYLDHLTEGFIL